MENVLLFVAMFVFFGGGMIIGIVGGKNFAKQEEGKYKNTLYLGEMKELANKHEKVDENIFILLATDAKELAYRKELVAQCGYYKNVTFFSDGSVFVDNRNGEGVTCWLGKNLPKWGHKPLPETELPPL